MTKLEAVFRVPAILLLLLCASCAGLDRNDQGNLQPQSVRGPCQVKKFFLSSLQTVQTDMVVGNVVQACTFTVVNYALNAVLTGALLTERPSHGQATADLIELGRQGVVSYVPQPGYLGPDHFTITFEPRAIGISVNVTVQPAAPPASP